MGRISTSYRYESDIIGTDPIIIVIIYLVIVRYGKGAGDC